MRLVSERLDVDDEEATVTIVRDRLETAARPASARQPVVDLELVQPI